MACLLLLVAWSVHRPRPESPGAAVYEGGLPQLVALVNATAPADDLFGVTFCAGVLARPRVVITARHCVADQAPRHMDAVVGASNLCRTKRVQGERIGVTSVRLHPRRDIAALTLSRAAEAPPLRLAVDTAPHWPVIAVGWGRTARTERAPCTPRPVVLAEGERTRCRAAVRVSPIPRAGICAEPAVGERRNTCIGDSGGPVVERGRHGSIVLLAVVSWGMGCRIDDVGFYAPVSHLGGWLLRGVEPAASVT